MSECRVLLECPTCTHLYEEPGVSQCDCSPGVPFVPSRIFHAYAIDQEAQPEPMPKDIVWSMDVERLIDAIAELERRALARIDREQKCPINDRDKASLVALVGLSYLQSSPLLLGTVTGGDATHNTMSVRFDQPAPWASFPLGSCIALSKAPDQSSSVSSHMSQPVQEVEVVNAGSALKAVADNLLHLCENELRGKAAASVREVWRTLHGLAHQGTRPQA